VILLPTHACLDGAPDALPYGELDRANVATCSVRVRWGVRLGLETRLPGCGARIAVCHGCGLRTRVNGAPCGACGGADRPTQVLTAEPARASGDVVDPTRSIVQDEAPRENERPPETKQKAQRRAPTKRVKPTAADEANGLPLFK